MISPNRKKNHRFWWGAPLRRARGLQRAAAMDATPQGAGLPVVHGRPCGSGGLEFTYQYKKKFQGTKKKSRQFRRD